MKLSLYQIDAFAERVFEGNPAAVVPLDEWLPDETLQAIAGENNLAETAYFVPQGNDYHIRWFAPNKEVALFRHATLAAAYVIFSELQTRQDEVVFNSLSGELTVTKNGRLLTLNFPVQRPASCDMSKLLSAGLGKPPVKCLKHAVYIAVFDSEEDILSVKPDYMLLSQLDLRGVTITAPSDKYDFVVRVFTPKYAIPEDAVTGSAYTQLIPYWSELLGKPKLHAKQVSARGGELFCELQGDRVLISGYAIMEWSTSL